jgi:hypothetical protein
LFDGGTPFQGGLRRLWTSGLRLQKYQAFGMVRFNRSLGGML